MKKTLLISILTNVFIVKAQETTFFVHAHQDDAVYFSAVPFFNKISTGVKTVSIMVTAADQGAHNGVYSGDAGSGVTTPFYQARDNGYKRALEYCYTNSNVPLSFNETTSEVVFSGKRVRKWTYGNGITTYFLDLPNGECCSLNLAGYSANNYQTIEKLKKGQISTITNVTGTTTYTWAELKNTVKAIFEAEKGTTSNVYSADVNFSNNPNDHVDHYISSVLALEAMDELIGFNSKLHVGYALSSKTPNLSESDKIKKISTFGAMVSGIASKGYRVSRHLDWFAAEYIRDANIHNELVNLNSNLRGNSYVISNNRLNVATNIALNKTVQVSGEEYSTEGSKANDGNLDTYWGNTAYPQWWKVDLGANYNVNDITVINFNKDTRYYKYKVYSSTDNINWTVVANKSDTNLATASGDTFTFSTPINARYLRVDLTYNSVNQGVHIVEFIAHGTLAANANRRSLENKSGASALYTNPIKKGEPLTINFGKSKDNEVSIYDLNGKQVFRSKFNDQFATINTSFILSGVYIIDINGSKSKAIVE